MEYTYYINGEWKNSNFAQISIHDGGFLLGDGLFETIRFDKGKLFQIEKHLKRLFEGLNTIRINLRLSNSDITNLLINTIEHNSINSGLLRLMVTRGKIEGEPWKYNGPAHIYITIRPFSEPTKNPVKVVFYSEKNYPIIRFSPAIKSLNYIGNMLAKKDAGKEHAYEPVFYNADGFITECAIRNIFFIKKNKLLTPAIGLGVLPGVMREIIISNATKLKLDVIETKISIESINSMDEAFISSTGIGLLPCVWNGWNSNFIKTNKIKKTIDELIHYKDSI